MNRYRGIAVLASLMAHFIILPRAHAVCDIEADSCCAGFEHLGMGDRVPFPLVRDPHQVFTYIATPVQHLKHEPKPTIADPFNTKLVETNGGMRRLTRDFRRQLEAERVAPTELARVMTVFQELTQNAADAHVRNGTAPDSRRIVVRLKINRRQLPVKGGSEPVDRIILEVADNAGNPSAKKNGGSWFSGGRASGADAAKARETLDRLSGEMKNPVAIAKARGITQKAEWENSREYRDLEAETEKHNAPILEKMSDAELPADIIAEYFDAKTPSDAETGKILAALSQAEADIRTSEMVAERTFWLYTRFGVREKNIAVESREGGTGGFGSLLMKAWGSQWSYGPNRDRDGNVLGTRTMIVIETPSSPLTNPQPIGFAEEPGKEIIIPGAKSGEPARVIDPGNPPLKRRSLILPEQR